MAGDSAGGNLSVAVALRCADAGVRAPDAILACYPALYLQVTERKDGDRGSCDAGSPRLKAWLQRMLRNRVCLLCLQTHRHTHTVRFRS